MTTRKYNKNKLFRKSKKVKNKKIRSKKQGGTKIPYVGPYYENPSAKLWDGVYENNYKMVEEAFKEGADVNMKNDDGAWFLIVAAEGGNERMVNLFLEKGIDVNITDHYNNTALSTAVRNSRYDVVELLLKNGADINKENNDGDTPLHEASKNKKDKAIEFLVENGADLTIENNNFKTPLDIIAEKYVEEPDKEIMTHKESVNIHELQSKNVRILMEDVKSNPNNKYNLKQLESELSLKQDYIDEAKGNIQQSIETKEEGMKFITSIIKKAFHKKTPLVLISTNPIVKEIYDKFERVKKNQLETFDKIAEKKLLPKDIKNEIASNFGGKGGKRKTKKMKTKKSKKKTKKSKKKTKKSKKKTKR